MHYSTTYNLQNLQVHLFYFILQKQINLHLYQFCVVTEFLGTSTTKNKVVPVQVADEKRPCVVNPRNHTCKHRLHDQLCL